MSKERMKYSPELKVKMILEGLCYPDGICAYCRKKGIRDVLFYKWKNQIITRASDIFKANTKEINAEIKLNEAIAKKDQIIAVLVEEMIILKKAWGMMLNKHLLDKDIIADIIITIKQCRQYGIKLSEILKHIELSKSRYYEFINRLGKQHTNKPCKTNTVINPYAITESERLKILSYARNNGNYYHRELSYKMIDEDIVYVSPSSCYRVLKEKELIREYKIKTKCSQSHKYSNKASLPDELWQADITYLKYQNKDIYQLSFIDVYSRYIVLSVSLLSMDGHTVTDVFNVFIEKNKSELKRIPTLQTDNGSCFISSEFKYALHKFNITHNRIHPGTPTENAIIERWNRTFKELLYLEDDADTFEVLIANTEKVCYYYNHQRYHKSLRYVTPHTFYRGDPEEIFNIRKQKLECAKAKRKFDNIGGIKKISSDFDIKRISTGCYGIEMKNKG